MELIVKDFQWSYFLYSYLYGLFLQLYPSLERSLSILVYLKVLEYEILKYFYNIRNQVLLNIYALYISNGFHLLLLDLLIRLPLAVVFDLWKFRSLTLDKGGVLFDIVRSKIDKSDERYKIWFIGFIVCIILFIFLYNLIDYLCVVGRGRSMGIVKEFLRINSVQIFFCFLCLKCFVNYAFRPLASLAKPHRLAALR